MLQVSEKLHLYEFDDGETHYILAESKESADKWYKEEWASADVLEEGYDIKEIPRDTEMEISNIIENSELYSVVNRYRIEDENLESIPVWSFIKWDILEHELRGEDYLLPQLIASSAY